MILNIVLILFILIGVIVAPIQNTSLSVALGAIAGLSIGFIIWRIYDSMGVKK